jgi:uncharacterized protein (DUF58 family)
VTVRGVALLVGGALIGSVGWYIGWPELTLIGAGAVGLVCVVLVGCTGGSVANVVLNSASIAAVRGESASLRVTVRLPGRRRRFMRLVDGPPATPTRSVRISHLAESILQIPVSTERRGVYPVGPFRVIRGDPWGVIRRVRGSTVAGSLVVRPRTHPVRRGFGLDARQGEADAMTRRAGDDHFFALRDYVLGDEPRNVHWRSSARSGRLVVKQRVAASTDGILLVLDADATAYGSGGAFAEIFLDERFELAVEVLASIARSRSELGQRVHVATTSTGQPVVGPGLSAVLDFMATVCAVVPVETEPAVLSSIARRHRCTQLVVVSGNPRSDVLAELRRCRALSPILVRVRPTERSAVRGAWDIDEVGALA